MRPPDALDRADADRGRLGHGGARPMCRVRRRSSQGQAHHAVDNLGSQGWDARRACLIVPQARDAFIAEPFLPPPNDRLGLSSSPHDLGRAVAIRGQQDDLGSPDMFLRTVPVGDNCLQHGAVGGIQCNLGSFVHSPDSHSRVRRGILKRIEMSDLVH